MMIKSNYVILNRLFKLRIYSRPIGYFSPIIVRTMMCEWIIWTRIADKTWQDWLEKTQVRCFHVNNYYVLFSHLVPLLSREDNFYGQNDYILKGIHRLALQCRLYSGVIVFYCCNSDVLETFGYTISPKT